MTDIEKLIKEKEEELNQKREKLLNQREQYLNDREQLISLKEKNLENKLLETELTKPVDKKDDPIEIAKSMIAEMSKELISELKEKEKAYREQV